MSFQLLQKVRILESAREYNDIHGEVGHVVTLSQMLDQPFPEITVLLSKGDKVEGLFPSDLAKTA